MRESTDAFHLAVPARDLAEAERFYTALGCQVARRYDDRVTFNFFGDQLVCHHSPDEPIVEPKLYPRHFGVTFKAAADFEALLRIVDLRDISVFQKVQLRFEGTAEEHRTIALIDPSQNLLEFKHYADPRMMY
ncbi:VOC family protein [Frankia sp. CiP1_Cm_nod2]|uniref:VOC family protein n=1 Tax=Frankia sp. CiP1_Cm_nod2 TaxID=2897161 RepID=UPI002024BD37